MSHNPDEEESSNGFDVSSTEREEETNMEHDDDDDDEVEVVDMMDEPQIQASMGMPPNPPTISASRARMQSMNTNLSDHSGFSAMSLYSASGHSVQSESTIPRTNVTTVSRSSGSPSQISSEVMWEEDSDSQEVDSSPSSEKSKGQNASDSKDSQQEGPKLPSKPTPTNPPRRSSFEPDESGVSFAHDADDLLQEASFNTAGNPLERSMTASQVFRDDAQPPRTSEHTNTSDRSQEESTYASSDRGSSYTGGSSEYHGSSYASYTDESTIAETPFFSPTKDLRQPGMHPYGATAAGEPRTPGSMPSRSGTAPPVTPQEKWALKKFLSAPFLNNNKKEADAEFSENDDSMAYSYDSSKMSGVFSAAGSLFSLDTYATRDTAGEHSVASGDQHRAAFTEEKSHPEVDSTPQQSGKTKVTAIIAAREDDRTPRAKTRRHYAQGTDFSPSMEAVDEEHRASRADHETNTIDLKRGSENASDESSYEAEEGLSPQNSRESGADSVENSEDSWDEEIVELSDQSSSESFYSQSRDHFHNDVDSAAGSLSSESESQFPHGNITSFAPGDKPASIGSKVYPGEASDATQSSRGDLAGNVGSDPLWSNPPKLPFQSLDESFGEASGQTSGHSMSLEKSHQAGKQESPHDKRMTYTGSLGYDSDRNLAAELSDSSLSSGELAELNTLLEKQDNGENIDLDRLYELDLLDRLQSGEPLNNAEKVDIQRITQVRRRHRAYRKEFLALLDRSDKGKEVDEDRLYCLELMERQRIGEFLSQDEELDLQDFKLEEKERISAMKSIAIRQGEAREDPNVSHLVSPGKNLDDSLDIDGSVHSSNSPNLHGQGTTEPLSSIQHSSDSSLSSAELEELNELLEQQEYGRDVDSTRLYNLDLFDRYMSGEPLDEKEKANLVSFKEQRRRERQYRQEFLFLLGKSERGEPIDEDRLYCLELMERQRAGDELSGSERVELGDFVKDEKFAQALAVSSLAQNDGTAREIIIDSVEVEDDDLPQSEERKKTQDGSSSIGSSGSEESPVPMEPTSPAPQMEGSETGYSSLSSGEMNELNDLIEQRREGEAFDEERLYELDLFEKWSSGCSMESKEQEILSRFMLRRKRERAFRREFEMLLDQREQGLEINEKRLYCLELFARRHLGEQLSMQELQELSTFENQDKHENQPSIAKTLNHPIHQEQKSQESNYNIQSQRISETNDEGILILSPRTKGNDNESESMGDTSSLSSGEIEELNSLLDRQEAGESVDEARLYELDLFDRFQSGESLSDEELGDLEAFKARRKKERAYRREFQSLLDAREGGEEVDEDRLYSLELYARRHLGEDLTDGELRDLEAFEADEAAMQVKTARVPEADEGEELGDEEQPDPSRLLIQSPGRSASSRSTETQESPSDEEVSATSTGSVSHGSTPVTNQGNDSFERGVHLSGLNQPAEQPSSEEDSLGSDLFEAPKKQEDRPLLAAAMKARAAAEAQQDQVVKSSINTSNGDHLAALNQPLEANSSDEDSLSSGELFDEAVEKVVDRPLLAAARKAKALQQEESQQMPQIVEEESGRLDTDPVYEGSQNSVYDSEAVVSDESSRRKADDHDDMADESEASSHKSVSVKEESSTEGDKIAGKLPSSHRSLQASEGDTSSLSSGEIEELNSLLDRQEAGESVDEARLYELDLFDRFQSGESLSDEELGDLEAFKARRKKERAYRREFQSLLDAREGGEEVDEDRLYSLELYARRHLGEDLTDGELRDLEAFEADEAAMQVKTARVPEADEGEELGDEEQPDPSRLLIQSPGRSASSRSTETQESPSDEEVSATSTGSVSHGSTPVTNQGNDSFERGVHLSGLNQPAEQPSSEEDSLGSDLFEAPKKQEDRPLLAAAMKARAAAEAQQDQVVKSSINTSNGDHLAALNQPLEANSSDEDSLSSGELFDEAVEKVVDRPLLAAARKAKALQQEESQQMPQIVEEESGRLDTDPVYEGSQNSVYDSEAVVSDESSRRKADDHDDMADESEASSHKSVSVKEESSTEGDKIAGKLPSSHRSLQASEGDTSSLSSGEIEELNSLLDRQEAGESVDEARLYELDLFDRFQSGESLSDEELGDLEAFKARRKKERAYRREFQSLLDAREGGEEVDEDRLYSLELYARRHLGEDLTDGELRDLEAFEADEAAMQVKTARVPEADEGEELGDEEQPDPSRLLIQSPGRSASSRSTETQESPSDEEVSATSTGSVSHGSTPVTNQGNDSFERGVHLSGLNQPAEQPSSEEDSLGSDLFEAPKKQEDRPLLAAAMKARAAAEAQQDQVVKSSINTSNGDHLAALNQPLEANSSDEDSLSSGELFDEAVEKVVDRPLLAAARKAKALQQEESQQMPQIVEEESGRLDTDPVYEGSQNSVYDSEAVVSDESSRRKADDHDDMADESEASSHKSVSVKEESSTEGDKIAGKLPSSHRSLQASEGDTSSLSSGEIEELNSLLDRQEAGESVDEARLYELDLFDRFQSGESLPDEELGDLEAFKARRKKERAYRREFQSLLDAREGGEEVDEDRLYSLELYARRHLGEDLTDGELRDLEAFEADEAAMQVKTARVPEADEGEELGGEEQPDPSRLLIQSPGRSASSRSTETQESPSDEEVSATSTGSVSHGSTPVTNQGNDSFERGVHLSGLNQPAEQPSSEEDSLGSDLFEAPKKQEDRPLLAAAMKARAAAEAQQDQVVKSSINTSNGDHLAALNQPLEANSSDEDSLSSGELFDEAVEKVVDRPLLAAARKAKALQQEESQQMPQIVEEESGRLDTDPVYEGSQNSVYDSEAVVSDESSRRKADDHDDMADESEASSHKSVSVKEESSTEGDKIAGKLPSSHRSLQASEGDTSSLSSGEIEELNSLLDRQEAGESVDEARLYELDLFDRFQSGESLSDEELGDLEAFKARRKKERAYRREFQSLLDAREGGEEVDEDRLYSLELYARRHLGEDLTDGELRDLEAFEADEAAMQVKTARVPEADEGEELGGEEQPDPSRLLIQSPGRSASSRSTETQESPSDEEVSATSTGSVSHGSTPVTNQGIEYFEDVLGAANSFQSSSKLSDSKRDSTILSVSPQYHEHLSPDELREMHDLLERELNNLPIDEDRLYDLDLLNRWANNLDLDSGELYDLDDVLRRRNHADKVSDFTPVLQGAVETKNSSEADEDLEDFTTAAMHPIQGLFKSIFGQNADPQTRGFEASAQSTKIIASPQSEPFEMHGNAFDPGHYSVRSRDGDVQDASQKSISYSSTHDDISTSTDSLISSSGASGAKKVWSMLSLGDSSFASGIEADETKAGSVKDAEETSSLSRIQTFENSEEAKEITADESLTWEPPSSPFFGEDGRNSTMAPSAEVLEEQSRSSATAESWQPPEGSFFANDRPSSQVASESNASDTSNLSKSLDDKSSEGAGQLAWEPPSSPFFGEDGRNSTMAPSVEVEEHSRSSAAAESWQPPEGSFFANDRPSSQVASESNASDTSNLSKSLDDKSSEGAGQLAWEPPSSPFFGEDGRNSTMAPSAEVLEEQSRSSATAESWQPPEGSFFANDRPSSQVASESNASDTSNLSKSLDDKSSEGAGQLAWEPPSSPFFGEDGRNSTMAPSVEVEEHSRSSAAAESWQPPEGSFFANDRPSSQVASESNASDTSNLSKSLDDKSSEGAGQLAWEPPSSPFFGEDGRNSTMASSVEVEEQSRTSAAANSWQPPEVSFFANDRQSSQVASESNASDTSNLSKSLDDKSSKGEGRLFSDDRSFVSVVPADDVITRDWSVPPFNTATDSSLTSGEMDELDSLLDRKESGDGAVDESRLAALEAFDKWQNGEALTDAECRILSDFRDQRKLERGLRKEFEDLLERREEGEEIDEARLYHLGLFGRKTLGESLTADEDSDLVHFLAGETKARTHDDPAVGDLSDSQGDSNDIDGLSKSGKSLQSEESGSATSQLLLQTVSVNALSSLEGGRNSPVSAEPTTITQEYRGEIDGNKNAIDLPEGSQSSEEEDSQVSYPKSDGKSGNKIGSTAIESADEATMKDWSVPFFNTATDSSLTSGEMDELDSLLDRKESGEGAVDESRLAALEAFDKWQNGEALTDAECRILSDFRDQRKLEHGLRKEFEDLLERREEGEEIDEARLYHLGLFGRKTLGESLTADEDSDLVHFLAGETKARTHDDPAVGDLSDSQGDSNDIDGLSKNGKSLQSEESGSATSQLLLQTVSVNALSSLEGGRNSPVSAEPTTITQEYRGEIDGNKNAIDLPYEGEGSQSSEEEDSQVSYPKSDGKSGNKIGSTAIESADEATMKDWSVPPFNTATDSSLTSGEMDELDSLLDRKESGEGAVDESRLAALEAFDKWQNGEALTDAECLILSDFRDQRKLERGLRKEFEDLLERREEGEEIDEARLYHLGLFGRKTLGESLTAEEDFDLSSFLNNEKNISILKPMHTATVGHAQEVRNELDSHLANLNQPLDVSSDEESLEDDLFDAPRQVVDKPMLNAALKAREAAEAQLVSTDPTKGVHLANLNQPLDVSSDEESLEDDLFDAPRQVVDKPLLNAALKAREAAEAQLVSTDPTKGVHLANLNQPLDVSSDEESLEDDLFDAPRQVVDKPLLNAALKAREAAEAQLASTDPTKGVHLANLNQPLDVSSDEESLEDDLFDAPRQVVDKPLLNAALKAREAAEAQLVSTDPTKGVHLANLNQPLDVSSDEESLEDDLFDAPRQVVDKPLLNAALKAREAAEAQLVSTDPTKGVHLANLNQPLDVSSDEESLEDDLFDAPRQVVDKPLLNAALKAREAAEAQLASTDPTKGVHLANLNQPLDVSSNEESLEDDLFDAPRQVVDKPLLNAALKAREAAEAQLASTDPAKGTHLVYFNQPVDSMSLEGSLGSELFDPPKHVSDKPLLEAALRAKAATGRDSMLRSPRSIGSASAIVSNDDASFRLLAFDEASESSLSSREMDELDDLLDRQEAGDPVNLDRLQDLDCFEKWQANDPLEFAESKALKLFIPKRRLERKLRREFQDMQVRKKAGERVDDDRLHSLSIVEREMLGEPLSMDERNELALFKREETSRDDKPSSTSSVREPSHAPEHLDAMNQPVLDHASDKDSLGSSALFDEKPSGPVPEKRLLAAALKAKASDSDVSGKGQSMGGSRRSSVSSSRSSSKSSSRSRSSSGRSTSRSASHSGSRSSTHHSKKASREAPPFAPKHLAAMNQPVLDHASDKDSLGSSALFDEKPSGPVPEKRLLAAALKAKASDSDVSGKGQSMGGSRRSSVSSSRSPSKSSLRSRSSSGRSTSRSASHSGSRSSTHYSKKASREAPPFAPKHLAAMNQPVLDHASDKDSLGSSALFDEKPSGPVPEKRLLAAALKAKASDSDVSGKGQSMGGSRRSSVSSSRSSSKSSSRSRSSSGRSTSRSASHSRSRSSTHHSKKASREAPPFAPKHLAAMNQPVLDHASDKDSLGSSALFDEKPSGPVPEKRLLAAALKAKASDSDVSGKGQSMGGSRRSSVSSPRSPSKSSSRSRSSSGRSTSRSAPHSLSSGYSRKSMKDGVDLIPGSTIPTLESLKRMVEKNVDLESENSKGNRVDESSGNIWVPPPVSFESQALHASSELDLTASVDEEISSKKLPIFHQPDGTWRSAMSGEVVEQRRQRSHQDGKEKEAISINDQEISEDVKNVASKLTIDSANNSSSSRGTQSSSIKEDRLAPESKTASSPLSKEGRSVTSIRAKKEESNAGGSELTTSDTAVAPDFSIASVLSKSTMSSRAKAALSALSSSKRAVTDATDEDTAMAVDLEAFRSTSKARDAAERSSFKSPSSSPRSVSGRGILAAYERLRFWDDAPESAPKPPDRSKPEAKPDSTLSGRNSTSWVAPLREKLNPFSHIRRVAPTNLVVDSRPDPPDERKEILLESSPRRSLQQFRTSYYFDSNDDNSISSTWAPPYGTLPIVMEEVESWHPKNTQKGNILNYFGRSTAAETALSSNSLGSQSDWAPPGKQSQPTASRAEIYAAWYGTTHTISSSSSRSITSHGSSRTSGATQSQRSRMWSSPVVQRVTTQMVPVHLDKPSIFERLEKGKGASDSAPYFGDSNPVRRHSPFDTAPSFENRGNPPSVSRRGSSNSHIRNTSDSESKAGSSSMVDIERGYVGALPEFHDSTGTESARSESKSTGDISKDSVSNRYDEKVEDSSSSQRSRNLSERSSKVTRNADMGHNQVGFDIEQGHIPEATERKKTFWNWKNASVVALLLLVVGGIAAAVIILLSRDNEVTSSSSQSPGSSPTSPPADVVGRVGTVVTNALINVGASGPLENPNSPQSRGLSWIQGSQNLSSYSSERILQRYVLAALFYAANGDGWAVSTGWLTSQDECTWQTSTIGNSICNANGLLDVIDLSGNNVKGSIPWADLSTLGDRLKLLSFSNNEITGTIPSQIGLLSSLNHLDLSTNRISGALPPELGSLTTLSSLELNSNFLTSSIPESISQMRSLETLKLNNNLFTGSIPSSLGNLTLLRSLELKNTFVTGTMPREICGLQLENLEATCSANFSCDCCTNIECSTSDDPIRDLIATNSPDGGAGLKNPGTAQSKAFAWIKSSDNESIASNERLLQRYALATFFYATDGDNWNAKSLWVSNADECAWFSTSRSSSVCDADGKLVELDLRENNLSGTFPSEILMLSERLQSIRLSQNAMGGLLPGMLYELSVLDHFDVSANALSGGLPSEFGLFGPSLTHLTVFDNVIGSTIPTELGRLTNLQVLDLGSNQLSGTIPSDMSRMTGLAGLSFFDNNLTGTLPCEMQQLDGLELFYLDANDLGPSICDDICRVEFLEFWSDCSEVQCSCCTTCCDDNFGCVAQ